MPLNKANFDGRASEPSHDDIMWEVTFTVTDTSSGTGGGGTSQSQETKSASFPITGSETAAEIASALRDHWNTANPSFRASTEGNEIVVFPETASRQRFKIGNGTWQTLGTSFSNLVDGVEVSDSAT